MSDEVRRRPNGSIDYDFYRAEAERLRRQAIRDAARSTAGGAAVMAGALGFALVIPSAAPVDRVAALLSSHLR
jgi:hypothetical protein